MSQRRLRCSERSAVGCTSPGWELDKGPFDAAFDIYIDDLLDCLHECTGEHWALGEASDRPFWTTSLRVFLRILIPWSLGCANGVWRNTVKSETMIIH
jgi:hypothetical protein